MSELTPVSAPPAAPERPADAHKGTFGTVIIIGGSATMMGAPALCAAAALRSGAGLVKIATTPDVLPVAITIEPGATGILFDDDVNECVNRVDEADPDGEAILAIGPGLGRSERTGELVMALLRGTRTVVLDADGLNLLAATGRPRPGGDAQPLVMTPHPGEFARLATPMGIEHSPTDPDERPLAAAALAEAHQAVVLLKGVNTIVTDAKKIYVNQTGNPALAVAGSGDVLTGLIAALLAQGMPAFDAACLGAHLHGLAADLWAADHTQAGLPAPDLARMLPLTLREHRQS